MISRKAPISRNDDLMNPGHLGCPGCGATIAMKFALQALGEKTMVVIPACCWGVIAGPYPQSALQVPILHTAFATAGAAASGLRAALDMRGDTETKILSWAGDGGTFDIGFQSLSGAVERNEDCIFIPYAATASIGYPEDMMRKFKKAGDLRGGSRFIHVLATCPTGWRIGSELSVKIARQAVQTNVFPLYEVEDGIRYTLNFKGDRKVKEYFTSQGRFKHLSDADINLIQQQVDAEWDLLVRKAKLSSS
ncbi:MAG: thiamine pyrophosphate-dependent enzyme [Desulfobacterales bacterium]